MIGRGRQLSGMLRAKCDDGRTIVSVHLTTKLVFKCALTPVALFEDLLPILLDSSRARLLP